MDVQRAKEIIQTTDKIGVTYQGEQVWIDSVDTQSQTAEVHSEHGNKEQMTVKIDQLQELTS